jgi:hypothetical protein
VDQRLEGGELGGKAEDWTEEVVLSCGCSHVHYVHFLHEFSSVSDFDLHLLLSGFHDGWPGNGLLLCFCAMRWLHVSTYERNIQPPFSGWLK